MSFGHYAVNAASTDHQRAFPGVGLRAHRRWVFAGVLHPALLQLRARRFSGRGRVRLLLPPDAAGIWDNPGVGGGNPFPV